MQVLRFAGDAPIITLGVLRGKAILVAAGGRAMNSLIECVPNFSEARRPEVVQAIADAIRAVPNARVLDVSSDLDHNRTVITFVGDPESVETGAYAAIAKA